jgi:hypothetical protein
MFGGIAIRGDQVMAWDKVVQKVTPSLILLILSVLIGGCPSHTLLSLKDQQKIIETRSGNNYFLRYSCFIGPFFSYDDRLFISERAFDERVLVESIGGDPILSAEPTAVLPFGTQVTIRKIEFPTGSVMSDRKLKSPRHFTWVTLDRAGVHESKPFVLVLTNEMRKPSDFDKALSGFLVKTDPRPEYASLAPAILEAIDTKRVVRGMRADALLRSRGHPDKISRKQEGKVRLELWQYAKDRVVELKDDVVESASGFPELDLRPLGEQAGGAPKAAASKDGAAPKETPEDSKPVSTDKQ